MARLGRLIIVDKFENYISMPSRPGKRDNVRGSGRHPGMLAISFGGSPIGRRMRSTADGRSGANRPVRRIAVVDDDRSVCTAICRLLRSAAFEAQGYPSAAEFTASLRETMPDCLILDVQMPDMSGLELKEHLRAWGETLPLIMITGHEDPVMHARCIAAGARKYLYKPVDEGELLGAVAEVLSSL